MAGLGNMMMMMMMMMTGKLFGQDREADWQLSTRPAALMRGTWLPVQLTPWLDLRQQHVHHSTAQHNVGWNLDVYSDWHNKCSLQQQSVNCGAAVYQQR
jgi:hypothetical protein